MKENELILEQYIVTGNISVVEAMKQMDENGSGILFITDEDRRLDKCLTDGDIRRWLIKTGQLNVNIFSIAQSDPKSLKKEKKDSAIQFMIDNRLKALPIVDDEDRIVDVIINKYTKKEVSLSEKHEIENTKVIIMAGGMGTRLYPYTKILPKPLIPIGEIPILERILNHYHQFGINSFYLVVNYKKDMIKAYFSDLKPAYELRFIDESKPLGTAGGIRLIKEEFDAPVIVTNCDILIETDYYNVMNFHISAQNDATIIGSLKSMYLPYGVLHTGENGTVISMEEKPKISHFINTGMYIVNPEFFRWIPDDTEFHMTDLIEMMIDKGKRIAMYPISEDSFLDMGEFEEMYQMEKKINERNAYKV